MSVKAIQLARTKIECLDCANPKESVQLKRLLIALFCRELHYPLPEPFSLRNAAGEDLIHYLGLMSEEDEASLARQICAKLAAA